MIFLSVVEKSRISKILDLRTGLKFKEIRWASNKLDKGISYDWEPVRKVKLRKH